MFSLLRRLLGIKEKKRVPVAIEDAKKQPATIGADTKKQPPPTTVVQKDQTNAPVPATTTTKKEPPAVSAAPKATGEAPVRLLIAKEFITFTDGVPFYEVVPSTAYVDIPFDVFLSEYYQDTAVISWRWKNAKPPNREAAVAALRTQNPVPTALVLHVKDCINRTPSIKYLWLDWACAPQYPEGDMSATMREINRSGTYYRKSAHIITWCFETVENDTFSFSDYFERAWTLSERLNRSRSESYLKGKDVIPLCLTIAMENSSSALRVNSDKWNDACKREIGAMKVLEKLSTDVMIGFSQHVLVARYPLLQTAFAAMNDDRARNGFLTKVLTAPVLALATTALQLKAASEWIKHPDDVSRVTVILELGMDFDEFVIFTVQSIIQAGRMRINNLPDKSLSNSIESYVGIEQGIRGGIDREGALTKIDECAANLFKLALESRTLEVADENWLGRYLTYEIALYRAFVEQDKLFAVYKLFDGVKDRTYKETELVWHDLCAKAGATLGFLSLKDAEEPWIKELSVVHSETDVGRPFFAVNKRSGDVKLRSSHPLHFGVLAFPHFKEGAAKLPQVFCDPQLVEVDELLTYFLGFNLEALELVALSKLQRFTLVDKRQGTDIDTHLSLRGRKALEVFELEFHAQIKACCSIPAVAEPEKPFVTKKNNGLFICVRYDGRRNLSKVVILRTSAMKEGVWAVEAVACFTGEPQKGSSWGIAKCLDNLIADICALGDSVAFDSQQFGKCDPWSETVKMENASKYARGDRDFMNKWVLATSNPAQPQTCFTDDLLPQSTADEGADDMEILLVTGKTTFDPTTEFARIRLAFRLLNQQGGGGHLDSYYRMLQRNYLVDTVMAQKIQYFGDLCEILTGHVRELPSLLQVPLIKQFFDYLVEDMIDAVDMAEDRVSGDVLEKVREQRRALMRVVDNDD